MRIAVPLGASVFACVVADLGFGRLNAIANRRQGELVERLEQAYRVAHPIYNHDLKPQFEGSTFWGPIAYTIRTDWLGFRSAAPSETPLDTPNARVLLIGDSFTEGIGVDYEATFAGRLAASVNTAGVDVLNAGVSSYSPAIYWKKTEDLLERRKLRVDGLVVFIDVGDVSDQAVEYRINTAGHVIAIDAAANTRSRTLVDLWSSNSLISNLVWRAQAKIAWARPARDCVGPDDSLSCQAAWTVGDAAFERYGRSGLREADAHMRQLAALLRKHAIPLLIVVYPWPQQLLWNDRHSRHVAHWQQWAEQERAEFAELFTPFFAEVDRLGVATTVDRYFIRDDIHWNASGHQLVAQALELTGRSWFVKTRVRDRVTAPASLSPDPTSSVSSSGSRPRPDMPSRAR